MKIQKITFITYFILAIVIAWFVYDWMNPDYEKRFRQNSEEFAENHVYFEKLIKTIKSQCLEEVKQNSSLAELSRTVSEKYREQLEEIGIENIEISCNEDLDCSEKLTFTFNVKSGYNIRTLRVVQIIYSPCDEQTKKGYHNNSNTIDVIGEGNNWYIFSDTDFI
jgi:hypothetical protein